MYFTFDSDDEELRHKEDHLTILKEQHTRINEIYILKLTKLEEELRCTTERQRQAEEKYKSEKHSLRGQIKVYSLCYSDSETASRRKE